MINIKKISIILIIMGVMIAAIPIVGQLYAKYQEDRMMEEWLNSIDAGELEDAWGMDTEAAYAQLQEAFGSEGGEGWNSGMAGDDGAGGAAGSGRSVGGSGTGGVDGLGSDGRSTAGIGSSGSADGSGGTGAGVAGGGGGNSPGAGIAGQKVLGVIQIGKIKVKEPLVEGVNKSSLQVGIGHIPGTSFPGQLGNCALAGHRNYAFKKLFSRLDELETGDEIKITTKNENLTYRVIDAKVVTPDDVSVLKGSKDRSIITLITCTPKYVASHRLIVTAELIERVLRDP